MKLQDGAASETYVSLDQAPEAPRAARWPSRTLWLALKLCVALGAGYWVFSRQPWDELALALSRLSVLSFVASCLLLLACLAVATLRWRLLMDAYGAVALPPLTTLLRVYCVGYFYNTYVPGGVGGDVLRGVVMRRSFGAGGATSGVTIVLVERALGLLGVVGVFALAAPFGASDSMRREFLPYCGLGLLGIVAVVVGVALGRRLARFAPTRLAKLLGALPELSRAVPFVAACLLSLLTQALVALSSHALLASIEPRARFVDSLIATPLATGAAFVPVGVAGAGPRDVVLVALYTALGVPQSAAAATTFAVLVSTLVVAGLGGLMQLFGPLSALEERDLGEGGSAVRDR